MRINLVTQLEKDVWNMKSINTRDKGIIILYSKGYSFREIGKIYSIDESYVRKRLKKLKFNQEFINLIEIRKEVRRLC